MQIRSPDRNAILVEMEQTLQESKGLNGTKSRLKKPYRRIKAIIETADTKKYQSCKRIAIWSEMDGNTSEKSLKALNQNPKLKRSKQIIPDQSNYRKLRIVYLASAATNCRVPIIPPPRNPYDNRKLSSVKTL